MTAIDLCALRIAVQFDHEPADVRAEVAEFLAGISAFSRGVAIALVRGSPATTHEHARAIARRAGA